MDIQRRAGISQPVCAWFENWGLYECFECSQPYSQRHALGGKELDITVTGTNKHPDELKRVVECLQGKHGLGAKEECEWALNSP